MTSGKSITFELTDGLTVDFDAINQGTYAALNGIKLTATGRILSKGRNVSMWKVEVHDDSSHLVAEATVTVAITGGGR